MNKLNLNLKDRLKQQEAVCFLRGNVKIFDDKGNVELDKDNAITNTFRKIIMKKLFEDIVNSSGGDLTTVRENGSFDDGYGYIQKINFGHGSSTSLGAKASKDDDKLISKISDTTDDGDAKLYINTSILDELNVTFDYNELKIQFTSDLINNDSVTYILGELGVFTSEEVMLTHLFFDPIYFEPNTTKKIVYTIYLY